MQNKQQLEKKIYTWLIYLYPKAFRKSYKREMIQVFQDLYEENQRNKQIFFWSKLVSDMLKSATNQHIVTMQRQGIKKYIGRELNINSYNSIGILLLVPFFSMLLLDAIGRIIQGNISHPNPIVYEKLSHTIIYNPPAIFLWAIVFPLSAAILNLLTLIPKIYKYNGNRMTINFIKTVIPTLIIIGIGLSFFTLIIGHDFIPCVITKTLTHGLDNIGNIISICRRA